DRLKVVHDDGRRYRHRSDALQKDVVDRGARDARAAAGDHVFQVGWSVGDERARGFGEAAVGRDDVQAEAGVEHGPTVDTNTDSRIAEAPGFGRVRAKEKAGAVGTSIEVDGLR